MAVLATVRACGEKINLPATAAIKIGQLVYYDGTRLVVSTNTSPTSRAEYVVVAGRADVTDEIVAVAKWAIFDDADLTTYTESGPLYLDTAGGITQTWPVRAANVPKLRQIVGRCITSAATAEANAAVGARYEIRIPDPRQQVVVMGVTKLTATTALVQLDSGFYGYDFPAASDALDLIAVVPPDAIAIVAAEVWHADEGDTAIATGTTWKFDVRIVEHSDAWDLAAHTDAIAAADVPTSTADDIVVTSIMTGFDGTGLVQPGGLISLTITKVAEAAINQDPIVIGVALTFLCV